MSVLKRRKCRIRGWIWAPPVLGRRAAAGPGVRSEVPEGLSWSPSGD
ncbi:hypothetical protein ACFU5O_00240 [Streptomyces sp. NPDC057445]